MRLADETAWVRLGAVRINGEWHQSLLDVTTGEPPPRWQELRWEYPSALFVATMVHGSTVSAWLEKRVASLEGADVRLPAPSMTVAPERLASLEARGYEPLRRPSVNFEVADGPLATGSSRGELLADRAPAFLNFATAARYVLGLENGGPSGFDHHRPAVRWQDLRGRIAGVRISAAEVEVEVEGDGLSRAYLELAGDAPGHSMPIRSQPTIRLPLVRGLAPGAWLVIRDRSEWLDRRLLDRSRVTAIAPDVELIVEGRTEVEALVADGESPYIEFKAELPASREARREVARTVAAFANGGGGTVLFGVRDIDGEIVGVAVEGRREASVDVSNWVKDLVVPVPEYDVRAVEVTDAGGRRVVVVLNVEPGTSRPYGVDPVKPSFYVRRGSTTLPATQRANPRPCARKQHAAGMGSACAWLYEPRAGALEVALFR